MAGADSGPHHARNYLMGTLIAALAALVLSTLNLLPSIGFDMPRHIALLVLTAFLVVRGLALWRQGQTTPTPVALEPAAPAPTPATTPAAPLRPEVAPGGEALILLSLLQEKGRFLDFLSEDITSFKDAQVAAASRVVHQGCAAVIRECLSLAPAHEGIEGDRITLTDAVDPHAYRLLGKAGDKPPYSGVVVHRGWKTTRLALPRPTRTIDTEGENIIAPVEVELR